MDEIVSFGQWVQIRRETLRLTRQQLADKVVCSPVTIKKIERDERRPSRQIATLLAEHLQIPASDRDTFLRWARGRFVTSMPLPDELSKSQQDTEPKRVERGTSQIPYNLPVQATPFIGREEELDTLDSLLVEESSRMVTIVGPGGMGKTRLALASAERYLPASSSQSNTNNQLKPIFPQGIFFVDLAPLSEPGQIAATVAEALDFQPLGQGSVREQLLNFLRRKRLLLLLDNFEHLLEGADLVANILQSAPAVQTLVTSQERLHLQSEQVFPIEGLEFPDWETPEDAATYTAVQLFLQSARRNRADFNLKEGDDLTYLARICRLVSGMPLAIELAAAWVDTLSLKEIAAEIQKNLDFLETEIRDVPERHRSIRAAFDGSWQKLAVDEQAVFAQLSVFRGGFTRQAALTVAQTPAGKPATFPILSRLVNKSFLRYSQAQERFQIHELLRQFGADKLAQDEEWLLAICHRHSHYFCQALHEWGTDLKEGQEKKAYTEMAADSQNIYTAWRWATDQLQVRWLGEAAFSLWRHYIYLGNILGGISAFQVAIDKLAGHSEPEAQQVRARLTAFPVFLSRFLFASPFIQKESIQESLRILDTLEKDGLDVQADRALLLFALGFTIYRQEPEQAHEVFSQSLELFQQIHDVWSEAFLFYSLGLLATGQEQYSEAKRYLEMAIATHQKTQSQWGVAGTYNQLGRIYLAEQNYEKASDCIQKSLSIAHDLGFKFQARSVLADLGIIFTMLGQPGKGLTYFRDFLSVAEDLGDIGLISYALIHFGWVSLLTGDYDEGERQAQAGWELIQPILTKSQLGRRPIYYRAQVYQSQLALLKGDIDTAVTQANQAVQSLNGQKQLASELAYAQVWLGWAQLAEGQTAKARKLLFEALQSVNKLYVQEALLPLAYLLAQRAQTDADKKRTLALIGLYETTFPLAHYPFYEEIAAKFYPDRLAALPPDQVESAKAHGRSLELTDTVAELQAWLPTIGWGQSPDRGRT